MKSAAAVASVPDNTCAAVAHPICAAPPSWWIVSNAVAWFMIRAATVTLPIKLQQWKCRMRLKSDATMADHCDECNNGILEMMVATIDDHKVVTKS
ncbi:hypothetical protein RR48_13233 [Papilio machaon]|uniref:Uncharacterized protein n=1 Tax=Papilio machaon TaxID=76193 RepID=A0A194QWB9_PAPMA|nr:hypothetical protein RR48_13233 [Papilio machaon]